MVTLWCISDLKLIKVVNFKYDKPKNHCFAHFYIFDLGSLMYKGKSKNQIYLPLRHPDFPLFVLTNYSVDLFMLKI